MKSIFFFLIIALNSSLGHTKNEKSCYRGNETVFKVNEGEAILSESLSKDKSKLVTTTENGDNKIYDLNNNKIVDLKQKGALSFAAFNNDGTKLIISFGDKKSKIIDVKTGEEILMLDHKKIIRSATFSPDETKFAIADFEGNCILYDLKTGATLLTITHDKWVNSVSFSNDSSKLITSSGDGTSKVVEIATGKELFVIKHKNTIRSAMFSPDGTKIVTASVDGSSKVVDAKNGEELFSIKHGKWVNAAAFSDDGSKVVTASIDNSSKIYDLKSKQELLNLKLKHWVYSVIFDENNGQILTVSDNVVTKSKYYCTTEANQQNENSASDCEKKDKTLNSKLGNMIESSNRISLCKWGEKNGFDPKSDLTKLIKILDGKEYSKYEAEIFAVMKELFLSYPLLYEDLLTKYPKLIDIDTDKKSKVVACSDNKDPNQEKVWREGFKDFITNMDVNKISDFDVLIPFIDILSSLKNENQDYIHELMAQKLADAASANSDFNGVSYPKIYRLTYEATSSFFRDDPEQLTDLALIRPDSIDTKLVVFSTIDHPIDNEKETDYGFYMKEVDNFNLTKDGKPGSTVLDKNFKWTSGNKKYSAKVKVNYKAGGSSALIAKEDAPDYKKLWNNGLNGLIILGTNLKSSAHVMDYYLTYFKKEGFNCDIKKGLVQIKDLKKMMKEGIESGKIDYFIKEAHSDSDDRNVFTLDKSGYSLTCTNTNREESVQLIFPDKNEKRSVTLSNLEFSEYFKNREKNKAGPLIFFNTSCWSAKEKAVKEIEAVSSKLLIEIPALTSVDTFTNHNDSAEKLLLTKFRERGTYQEIREALNNNKGFKNRSNNHFIFPDDEEYDKYIREKLAIPLDVKINIFDNKNKSYSMDQD